MGFDSILPELLLLVAINLSRGDFINLRSTCHWVKSVLTRPFQKICLQDVGELTVLQWAAICGYDELIELAISNGAEIDLPYQGDLTLQLLGVRGNLNKRNLRHHCVLANRGIYYMENESQYRTPLFLAACCGHVKAIEVLLDCGAQSIYSGIMIPAHAAATQGNVLCMQAFVHHPGFDINIKGPYDSTFLHYAALGGEAMVKYILQLDGATNLVNARTRSGFTPLHCISTTAGDLDCRRAQVELLLQHGADIYAQDNDGYTPAHTLAYWGDFGCLQVLVDAGFDLRTRGRCGKTILHCPRMNSIETLAYLLGLEKGRDIIDIQDNHQLIVLHYASRASDFRVVEVLLRHGACRKLSDMLLVRDTECCDYSYPAGNYILGEAW